MAWDVVEKNRADHTHTPEVRSSSYRLLALIVLFSLLRIPKRACQKTIPANAERTPLNWFSATANRKKMPKKE